MTKEWDNLTTDDKFRQAEEIINATVDKIANGSNHAIWILESVICTTIKNFFHYLNDLKDLEISWENPVLDLHYSVDIDENLCLTYFRMDEDYTLNEDDFNKKIVSIITNLHNILLFESFSKGTIILKQNNSYEYVINSKKINKQLAHINNKTRKLSKIKELTHKKFDIPFKIGNKFSNEEIECKFIIEFTPLIIDTEKHTGHYSIITNFVSNKSMKNFCNEERNEIKELLIKIFKRYVLDFVTEENTPSKSPDGFFEMGFTGKLLIDETLKPDFIGGDTLKISTNNLSNQEMPQKKLTFKKSSIKLNEDEEKFLFLYAVEGVENYSKIAKKMFCSEQTVKNKAQNIQLKLGANSMAHATYLYFMGDTLDAD